MSDQQLRPATVEPVGEGRWVLHLRGELDLATAEELRGVLAGLACDDHPERLVVDLSETEFIDLVGARPLAEWQRAHGGDCPMVVRSARPSIRRVLAMVGLDGRCLVEESPPTGDGPA